MMLTADSLIPIVGIILDIRNETHDIKTFSIAAKNGGKAFSFKPGQCAMLGVPGVGEAMFSIASSPTNTSCMEFSIKAVGKLTCYMHKMSAGEQLTIRGPYGNFFAVDTQLKGRDLLFIAGGIGLAPLRSVIKYVFDKRELYADVILVYSARTTKDLVYKEEIENDWAKQPNTTVYTTIDTAEQQWSGHVGFVPDYIRKIGFNNKIALICGPPIMIKHSLTELLAMGFNNKQVFTTLEMRMKCGVGKCGRCNIGQKYVCLDGPVFCCDELEVMPDEY